MDTSTPGSTLESSAKSAHNGSLRGSRTEFDISSRPIASGSLSLFPCTLRPVSPSLDQQEQPTAAEG